MMTGEERKKLDKEIWQLLWPILLLTLAQKAGNLFEGVLVSVNSTEELTVMSICSPYIMLITTVSYGLGIAVNSLTGRLNGNGRWEGSWKKATKTMMSLLIICGALMSIVAAILLYVAFYDTKDLMGTGYGYMLPYLLGSPVILLFNVLISAMRGLNDSKTGMWMIFLSVPIQLFASWAFYMSMGIKALGLGMLLSKIVGCAFGIMRYKMRLPESKGEEELPQGFVADFLKLAVPVSLSKMVSPVAGTILNGLILSVGSVYVGANGLAGRMEAFFYLPAMAMGSVAITLVSRETSEEELWPLCKRLCMWSVFPTLAAVITAKIFAAGLWRIMAADRALCLAGEELWNICLWAYPLIALEMTFTGILQARGIGLPTLVITVIRLWVVQLPVAALAVRMDWGAPGIWTAFLLSNVCSLVVSFIWVIAKLKQEKVRR